MNNKLVIYLNDNFDVFFKKWLNNNIKGKDVTDKSVREKLLEDFFYYNWTDIVDIVWGDVEEVLLDRCEDIIKES
jgi:hypothetical protein